MNDRSDIQIDSNGDLYIDPNVNDILIDLSDEDHIADIAISYQGEWKQTPLLGLAIPSYLKQSNAAAKIIGEAKKQYQSDGYKSSPLVVNSTSGELTFNPRATRP